jgi:putative heme-binding domain-containing protein
VSWWRETAQRLLVERQDRLAVPALESLAVRGNEVARGHALWTLEGWGALDEDLLVIALGDRNPRVREQALRLAARRSESPRVLEAVLALRDDPDPAVQFRLALWLGKRGTRSLDTLAELLSSRELSKWDSLAAVVSTGASGGSLVRELVLQDAGWLTSPSGERIRLLQLIGETMAGAPGELRQEFIQWLDALPEEFVAGKVAIQVGLARGQQVEARDRRQALEEITNVDADRGRIVGAYGESLNFEGDRQQGARHFIAHCHTCHPIQGLGPAVGPDITSVAARPKEELVVDILDPSRRVSPDFLAYMAVTKDGTSTEGLIAAETGQAVTLRRERGEEVTFRLADLVDLRASRKSTMPDGFETKLDAKAMADLLAFLKSPSRELVEALARDP